MHYQLTTLTVADMEKSLHFYTKVLGLTLKKKLQPREGMTICFLTDGQNGVLELIGYDKIYEGRGEAQRVCLGYGVDNLEEWIERLAVDQVPIKRGPIDAEGGLRFLFIEDPNGVEIELIEGFVMP